MRKQEIKISKNQTKILYYPLGWLVIVFLSSLWAWRDNSAAQWAYSEENKSYTLLSYMIVHTSIFHLIANMLALYFIWKSLRKLFSNKFLLFFLLLTGILSPLSIAVKQPVLGSSAAIYSLMAMDWFVYTCGLYGCPAKWGILRYSIGLALGLVISIFLPNIAWQLHFAGFIWGVLLALPIILYKQYIK